MVRLPSARFPSVRNPRVGSPEAVLRPDVSDIGWSNSGSLTGITVTGYNFYPTERSIGMYVQFTEGTGGEVLSSVDAEFRTTADPSNVRSTLPLWANRPSTGTKEYAGSVVLLTPGTEYQIRLTLQNPAGTKQYIVANVTTLPSTRIDAIMGLTPTRFVRADGNDNNAGTADSSGGAWATIGKALASAPSGAIVQVGTGSADEFYVGDGIGLKVSGRTSGGITFIAKFDGLNDAREEINIGQRAFIVGPINAGPTGSGFAIEAPWTSETLVGPTDGLNYQVWKWTGASATQPENLCYGSTRAAFPKRVPRWKSDASRLATPAGWAELMYTNMTYRYGFYQSGSDLYVRMPGDENPNTYWWTAGAGSGISVSANACKFKGLVFRGLDLGIQLGPSADNVIIKNCDFQNCGTGVTPWVSGSGVPELGIIRHCRVKGTGTWSEDQEAEPTVPWSFIKENIKLPDGSEYPTNKVGEALEGTGYGGYGGRGFEVSDSTVEGVFNGVGCYQPNTSTNRYGGADWDVFNMLFRYCADDCLEPEEYAGMNWRIWNNRVEQSLVFLSTGPVRFGPLYVFRNVTWKLGTSGLAPNLLGEYLDASSLAFKYASTSSPRPKIYVINNTFWTDDIRTGGAGSNGGTNAATGGSNASTSDAFVLINNIFRTTRNGFEWLNAPLSGYTEDYNQFTTSDQTRGMKLISPNTTYGTWALYKTASGQGAHSNPIGLRDFATADSQHENTGTGDLRLTTTSVLRNIGIPVANICDRAGVDYVGAAPDLGYQERS